MIFIDCPFAHFICFIRSDVYCLSFGWFYFYWFYLLYRLTDIVFYDGFLMKLLPFLKLFGFSEVLHNEIIIITIKISFVFFFY